jgi:hypothetical protein
MVSCQKPSPLKGSKQSLQRPPPDAALVNAHSFVSMGVNARCRPCHSATHCRHINRQPSHCPCCPCHGHHHCDRRCHLRCRRRLRHRRRCCRPLPLPSPIAIAVAHCRCRRPLRSPLTIAATVSVALLSAIPITVALAIGHCHFCHCRPSQLPSPLAITVYVAVGHFRELLPWRGKNCTRTI